MYERLKFGKQHAEWGVVDVVDEHDAPTDLVAIRGNVTDVGLVRALVAAGKRIVGLSSYENYPQRRINPHNLPGADEEAARQLTLDNAILWLHCFKDPQNYVSPDTPLLLHSESDHYAIRKEHKPRTKAYDFCCYLPQSHAKWNNWIRGAEVAVRWLNFMADEMRLAVLVVGAEPSIEGLSGAVTAVGFQPYYQWLERLGECRYLICFSRYDASPRIIMDALMSDIPVLLNESILGGWKYINKDTGKLFFHDADVRRTVTEFTAAGRSPRRWVDANHSVQRNQATLARAVNRLLALRYEDVVDGVMFINLEDRTDRLAQITGELERHGIPQGMVHRVDAVADDVCGHLGCTRSHMRAMEHARARGWRRFIVLEDDFVFKVPKERALHVLTAFLSAYKDDEWDVFMLGLFPDRHTTHDTDVPFIKRLVYSTTSSGYMVNARYSDVLRANMAEGEALCAKEVDAFAQAHPGERKLTTKFPVDQYWNGLQRRDRWYTSDGHLGRQSGVWSSIMAAWKPVAVETPLKPAVPLTRRKLAFCFLIYDVINHEDAWGAFFDGVDEARYSIYVHYKTDTPMRPFFESRKLRADVCVQTAWAGISIVEATNVLLRTALDDQENTSFILVSGACIPLKRFDHVYDAIGEASYFNLAPHEQCFPRCNAALRLLARDHVQKAQQWCILNRRHAQMMVNEAAAYIDWFDICPDEHCYISLIFHRGLQHEIVATPNLAVGATTFTNWGAPYKYAASGVRLPKTYASISTEELAHLLSSASLFGRKFAVECAPVLRSAAYLAAVASVAVAKVPSLPTVLVFWSVENSERCVDLITRNVSALSRYPSISFAISHFDGQSDRWSGLAWYGDARVVYKSTERGTKTYQWRRLRPEMVKGYDYIWMCDCDLGFERADLGVILAVLSMRNVWYCQTSLVGKTPSTRSASYAHLRYSPDKPILEWCHGGSEIGAPILHKEVWPLVHEHVCLMDDQSDWGIDWFWDELLMHKQGRPFPLIHTPLVHYDFRNYTANGAVRRFIPSVPIPDKARRFAHFWEGREASGVKGWRS